MEHLDFNVGSTTMPLLRETWFRQAVVYAIDRAAVAAVSHEPVVSNHPALHNLSFSSIEPDYEPVFSHYVYDLQTVAGLMGAHGCTRVHRRDLVVRRDSRLRQARRDGPAMSSASSCSS